MYLGAEDEDVRSLVAAAAAVEAAAAVASGSSRTGEDNDEDDEDDEEEEEETDEEEEEDVSGNTPTTVRRASVEISGLKEPLYAGLALNWVTETPPTTPLTSSCSTSKNCANGEECSKDANAKEVLERC
jgi:hypothetical protein